MGYLTVGAVSLGRPVNKRKSRPRPLIGRGKILPTSVLTGHSLVGGGRHVPSIMTAPGPHVAPSKAVSAVKSPLKALVGMISGKPASEVEVPWIDGSSKPSGGGGGGWSASPVEPSLDEVEAGADSAESPDDLEPGEESENVDVSKSKKHSWLLYAGLAAAGYFLFIKK